jgi:hypothetical protein
VGDFGDVFDVDFGFGWVFGGIGGRVSGTVVGR